MSSYGTRFTLKTSDTTNLGSEITIMATKTMSDEKPAFRNITGFWFFSRIRVSRLSLSDSAVKITLETQFSLE